MLKGHKRGCKCVGCSPATRKRGMAALKSYSGKKRRKRNAPKLSAPALKSIRRKAFKIAKAGKHSAKRRARRFILRAHGLPKTANPKRRRRNPPYGYGAETKVIWNRPRRKARHRNPARLIGSRPTLYLSGGKRRTFTGVLVTGTGPRSVVLKARAKTIKGLLGETVRRIEYDNRGKALRAYGKPGRFYHDFKGQVRVAQVAYSGPKYIRAVLVGKSPLWSQR